MEYQIPFWDGVRLADSESVTSTSFPEFDSSANRVLTRHATAGGELFISQWTDHCPARFRIKFHANTEFDLNVRVLADGATDWWVQINNGAVSNYTGPQDLTWSFIRGTNMVTIYKDATGADRLLLEALLFNGVDSYWLPPA